MGRRLAVVVSILATVVAAFGFASTAAAEPQNDTVKPSCVYTLSTPQLVQVSGTTMVHATLKPFPCTGSINPAYNNVCLRPEPDASAGRCDFSALPSGGEVFVPYKPGTTYIATGTGCGVVYTEEGSICSTLGPFRTTL